MRHRTPQFGHIFSGDGYSAGYYSYLWADTLTADAWRGVRRSGRRLRQERGEAPARQRLPRRQHHRSRPTAIAPSAAATLDRRPDARPRFSRSLRERRAEDSTRSTLKRKLDRRRSAAGTTPVRARSGSALAASKKKPPAHAGTRQAASLRAPPPAARTGVAPAPCSAGIGFISLSIAAADRAQEAEGSRRAAYGLPAYAGGFS